MMENPYQRLSPRGNVRPNPGRPYPGQSLRGHSLIPTLFLNYSVSGIPIPEKSQHLPLTDNCENSFWNAGKARAVVIKLHNQMGYQMI